MLIRVAYSTLGVVIDSFNLFYHSKYPFSLYICRRNIN